MTTDELAEARKRVEDARADLDVWDDRNEPDARARRYGSAAVDAIDSAIAMLQARRARLIGELRQADAEADVRADQLLAETGRLLAAGTDEPTAEPPAELMEAFRQATGPGRLDGCTCAAVRGSHKPPCQWAMSSPSPGEQVPPGAVEMYEPTGLMPQWSPSTGALVGYNYTLPEDYLRGGAQ